MVFRKASPGVEKLASAIAATGVDNKVHVGEKRDLVVVVVFAFVRLHDGRSKGC